jgi:hypothetical protein
MSDAIGQRGEAIFFVLMTKFHPERRRLFRPQFLGDKWPLVDYIVELENAGDIRPFFFVQVKTTREGYTRREKRLKVKVTDERVSGLTAYPAPTYIVGIDEVHETGYIVSANGENLSALSSLSIRCPLDEQNREALWMEVKTYWEAQGTSQLLSAFVDADWK